MKSTYNNFLWGFAFLLTGLAYIFGLFIDLTGDSGLYAAISRQMVGSGDWFNLQINGKAYDQKPHLFFWLAGAGIQLFGNTNFAFKLFPFLYGIQGIYFTYRLGKTIFSNVVGRLAALIVGTSQISFLYFFDFHMDSILQTGVILALWQLAEYLKFNKNVNFVFGFVGVGLAMFSKGPIGAVIPFFAVLFYLVSERDFKNLFHLKWLLGIFMVLVIISPSLYHLYKSFGLEGIKFFFITNNFGRISGEYAGSNTDLFFYLHTLIWAFLPWTFLVAFGLYSEFKSWFKKGSSNSWGYYLLGSTFLLLLVLSVAKGKAPNYMLICVAPLSVVVAKWLACKSYSGKVVLYSTLVIGSLNLGLNAFVFPRLFKYQAARQVLAIYETEKEDGDQLFNYHPEDYELFFYSKNEVMNVDGGEAFGKMLENKGTWIYTIKNGCDEILGYKGSVDSVYIISYKGMNNLSIQFLNPATRETSLDTTYLIKMN